jgi:hypothetical protein
MASVGDLLMGSAGADGTRGLTDPWRIAVQGDRIVATPLPRIGPGASEASFAFSDTAMVLGRRIVDPKTLERANRSTKAEHDGIGGSPVLAGKYLFCWSGPVGSGDGFGRNRQDRLNECRYDIHDLADPANPKPVSSNNMIGDSAMPPDIMDKHFPEMARNPDLKLATIGGYYGLGGFFGLRVVGPVFHGNRIYIQSVSSLYCIGEK